MMIDICVQLRQSPSLLLQPCFLLDGSNPIAIKGLFENGGSSFFLLGLQ